MCLFLRLPFCRLVFNGKPTGSRSHFGGSNLLRHTEPWALRMLALVLTLVLYQPRPSAKAPKPRIGAEAFGRRGRVRFGGSLWHGVAGKPRGSRNTPFCGILSYFEAQVASGLVWAPFDVAPFVSLMVSLFMKYRYTDVQGSNVSRPVCYLNTSQLQCRNACVDRMSFDIWFLFRVGKDGHLDP